MGNCIITKGGMGASELTLLWTNPNLSESQTAEQTLTFNYSNYDVLFVQVRISNSTCSVFGTINPYYSEDYQGVMWPFGSSGSGSRKRTFKCNSEKTTLEIGPANSSSDDTKNTVVLAIYGLSSRPIVHHITDYNFYGIDTNNVIATTTQDWTATQDCFAVQSLSSAYKLGINGIVLCEGAKSGSTDKGTCWIPVKQGQVVNVYTHSTTIYGIK